MIINVKSERGGVSIRDLVWIENGGAVLWGFPVLESREIIGDLVILASNFNSSRKQIRILLCLLVVNEISF